MIIVVWEEMSVERALVKVYGAAIRWRRSQYGDHRGTDQHWYQVYAGRFARCGGHGSHQRIQAAIAEGGYEYQEGTLYHQYGTCRPP